METTTMKVDPMLEATVRAMNALSPRSRELVALMVRQMAENEGVKVPTGTAQGLQTPAEGIPLWIAKLKQESYSKRTIELYLMTVKNYLNIDPTPTKLSIQQWLAERLDLVSTARVSNDRKALRSLFSFLYAEALWPNDPTISLKHIRVRYRAKEVPTVEDLNKLMQYTCFRDKDTPKFRTMLTLLITTGLRVTEAASVLRTDINFDKHEMKVMGKGGKEGMVPLLPITENALTEYMRDHQNGSPYLFSGDTGQGYWSIASFEKSLKVACRRLEIKKITPHQFRHFFADYALRSGAKLEIVSKILRHASVGITADIYRHVMPEELHQTARRFTPFGQGLLGEGKEPVVEGEFRELTEDGSQEAQEVPTVK